MKRWVIKLNPFRGIFKHPRIVRSAMPIPRDLSRRLKRATKYFSEYDPKGVLFRSGSTRNLAPGIADLTKF